MADGTIDHASSRLRALWLTPWRDVARGRISGSYDWRGRLGRSTLPPEVRGTIDRIVRRARLWRDEQSAVADELIGHFADALEGGASASAAIAAFGDVRRAARLIRRAKRRQRPITWHVRKWLTRGVAALTGLWCVLFVRFLIGTPRVTVDYLAEMNAPARAVPEADRAWPIYHRAAVGLGFDSVHDANDIRNHLPLDEDEDQSRWPEMVAWLDAHAADVELIREAAAKPALGYVIEPPDPSAKHVLGEGLNANDPLRNSLWNTRLPYLNELRFLSNVLSTDFRLAGRRQDAARMASDYEAQLAMSQHLRSGPYLVDALVRMGIASEAIHALGVDLHAVPERFDDATLIRLAHHTAAALRGEVAGDLIDLTGERRGFYDVMQRVFTDDGHGDGRLTMSGYRGLSEGELARWIASKGATGWSTAAVASTASFTNARRDNVGLYDRVIDHTARLFAHPLREASPEALSFAATERARLSDSPITLGHYLPATVLLPSLSAAGFTAERMYARRDGLLVGIACELYRRHHGGAWPPSAETLVPTYLPAVPLDRASGHPLRLAIVDGRPVVYGDGIDGDDDGGRPAENRRHSPDPEAAAIGQTMSDAPLDMHGRPQGRAAGDGDWIVFGAAPMSEHSTTRSVE